MIKIVCVCRLGQDYPASSYVFLCMCVGGEGGGRERDIFTRMIHIIRGNCIQDVCL